MEDSLNLRDQNLECS